MIDTASKRLAVAHLGRLAPVFPDGTLSTADRWNLNGLYVFEADVQPATPGTFATSRQQTTGTSRQRATGSWRAR